ncbi:hypothetical protein PQD76_gp37 [Stenotrophomonas phage BUCT626]|uniref:Uncharacterized protein n=1 Tax=Stenotrophomonas phage BUCT626 TaxID=2860376 RepID=A0AC61NKK5_9CAUD|nr:hypothetical protein PQD76_gp37 [Stenotrophomonas phage BUCT626]QYC96741.1 hypothetical protein [Stenotrophomonas phage BUCT626]
MKAKTIDRNLNRKRNWKRNSSRRFMRSNYRMRWASFPILGHRVVALLNKVDA